MAGIAKRERNRRSREAAAVTRSAYADPTTTCCQCDLPLHACGPNGDGRNANGTPCTWDAGHPDGRWPGSRLRAECSHCNRRRGAEAGQRMRSGYDW